MSKTLKRKLKKEYDTEEKRHDKAYEIENKRHEKRHIKEMGQAMKSCKDKDKKKK